MNSDRKKLLVIQAAALGYEFLCAQKATGMNGLTFKPLETVFPAVTCTVQGSFRTAALPAGHGMIANGIFFNELMKPLFWEQSSRLVKGPRIWESFRKNGGKVAMLFWQQSLGEEVDFLVSPAPIHKHHGGMVQSCYSKPPDLYEKMCGTTGRKFDLMHYWGPMASAKSSDWIASATASLLNDPAQAPDLCLTYLPVLDYDLQRFGPSSPEAASALRKLQEELRLLLSAAAANRYDVVIFGDYAMGEAANGAVLPNLLLKQAGLFNVRNVEGMLYPDFHSSSAFAVVDHEIAHVYIRPDADIRKVADVFREQEGIGRILDAEEQERAGIACDRSGRLVLVAGEGYWFAYKWWEDEGESPDYAGHVDIHNKPGYDPCELFWGWPPFSVSRNCLRIKGTHGRVGPDRQVAWASTTKIESEPSTVVELAGAVKDRLR